ncbi:MAG: MmcQ/YjbR family DNA-binding protein [Prevotella sp.]|nr:MmcQ/YjbR family DNA-binding protein [Prevotella sp.]
MNIESYRDLCLSMGEDVTEKMPFGAFKSAVGVLAFYVCGHMFSFFDVDHFTLITLKCDPSEIDELKERHSCIGPPANLSARYWIGVNPDEADDALLERLTRQSYEIVRRKYTR